MPWHLTHPENYPSIMKNGLVPAIGDRSIQIPEETEAVHLFNRMEDLEDAGWLDDAFPEDEKLILLHVSAPFTDGWNEVPDVIAPHRITLVSADYDTFIPNMAHYAMDANGEPFADVDSFRATRVEMTTEETGDLVSDMTREKEDGRNVLVYHASLFIEIEASGEHKLTLGTRDFRTAPGGLTLADLEQELFEWARAERGWPEPEEITPSP